MLLEQRHRLLHQRIDLRVVIVVLGARHFARRTGLLVAARAIDAAAVAVLAGRYRRHHFVDDGVELLRDRHRLTGRGRQQTHLVGDGVPDFLYQFHPLVDRKLIYPQIL